MNFEKHTEINIGIDTSQSQLDINLRLFVEFFPVSNAQEGIKEADKHFRETQPTRVVIEATGCAEMAFVGADHKAKLSVIVCNAGQIRQFTKALGWVAKTDKPDIAHFGEALKPRLTELKSEKLRKTSELLTVCSQCLEMSTMQKNRLHRISKTVQTPIRRIKKKHSESDCGY